MPKHVEHLCVLSDSFTEAPDRVVRDAVFFSRLTHDLGNVLVVYVTNVREQVVLYLEIQSAYIPTQKLVIRREVGRRDQLVHSPIVIHLAGWRRRREFGLRHHVCCLKDHRHAHSYHIVHQEEAE